MKRIKTFMALAAAFVALSAQALEVKQMITVAQARESFAQVQKVKVEGRFCKVCVLASQTDSVVVGGKLEAMKEHEAYKVVIDQAGAEVNLSVVVPDDAFSSFVGELTVGVPEGVSVEVVNTSGYIDVADLKNNDVALTTGQGKVKLTNSKGNITVDTKNGSITAQKLEGVINSTSLKGDQTFDGVVGTLSFDTPDGNVVVSNVEGNVKGKTVAGLQTFSKVNGQIDTKGSAGAIKVSLSEGVFKIKTLSAAVNFFEVKGEFHIETTKGPIVGQKGFTLTASSDFTTTEGKINLRLTNELDELTFALTSENSKAPLMAKKTNKTKKLNLGKGPIVITGKTKTGAQIFN